MGVLTKKNVFEKVSSVRVFGAAHRYMWVCISVRMCMDIYVDELNTL